MRFPSSRLLFSALCLFFAGLSATRSPQELESDAPSTSAIQPIQEGFFFGNNPVKQAPSLLVKKQLNRKDRAKLRGQLRKMTSGKSLKTLNETELRAAADICLALEQYDEALNFLKKLEKKSKNTTTVKSTKLEIADVTFQEGNLKTAAKLYDEYLNLYPGDREKAAYARYKGILSNFYSMLQKDRDQTITRKTIALADAFLESNSPLIKKYAFDVESIKNHCFTRLYEHDQVIFDFYVNRSSFKAAEKRLTTMRQSLLDKRPDLEPRFLECEIRLAQAQHDLPRLTRVSQELAQRFPEEVRLAQAKKSIPNYVTRF